MRLAFSHLSESCDTAAAQIGAAQTMGKSQNPINLGSSIPRQPTKTG